MRALRNHRRDLVVVAVIVAILAALALALALALTRAAPRLVPLLMPREVLSVGTGPMPAGGGGNCGREPIVAIAAGSSRFRH